jgi:AraC-like DNA-binding protein
MKEKNGRILPQKSVTSLDVARKAGVSRTAISYVLNEDGVRSTHVSEETRAKVLQAVQELGYSTHSSARALRKGQSDEICIIVDLPLSIHRTDLFISVQQYAFLHGYSPVVYFSYDFSAEQVHSHLLKIFARPTGRTFAARLRWAAARWHNAFQAARADSRGAARHLHICSQPQYHCRPRNA